MTVDEIVNNTLPYFETKRKYYITGIVNNLKLYDQVEIYFKSNDDKYYIKTIIAAIAAIVMIVFNLTLLLFFFGLFVNFL